MQKLWTKEAIETAIVDSRFGAQIIWETGDNVLKKLMMCIWCWDEVCTCPTVSFDLGEKGHDPYWDLPDQWDEEEDMTWILKIIHEENSGAKITYKFEREQDELIEEKLWLDYFREENVTTENADEGDLHVWWTD